jgi:quinol monooxygenase YgiN
MIYNNILLTVQDPVNIETVRSLLIEQAELSRLEPGCARFEVYHSHENPSLFLLVEQWESQEHLDAHRKEKACVDVYFPKILPLVDRVPHRSDRVI